jgi:hypothetical protein
MSQEAHRKSGPVFWAFLLYGARLLDQLPLEAICTDERSERQIRGSACRLLEIIRTINERVRC